MVKSCLVATCKNTIVKPGITFHKIGKKRYADRLQAIGRNADECLSPQNVICSEHYAEEDFIHFNGKKYLRIEALPRFLIPRRGQQIMTQIIRKPAPPPVVQKTLRKRQPVLKPKILTLDDVWAMYADLLITPEDNNIDSILNEKDLEEYPTNEFLTSLMSDGCDTLDFDLSLGQLES